MAGAEPKYIPCHEASRYAPDFDSVLPEEWERIQVLFVCSPSNPTGNVLHLEDWKKLFALADQYDFLIASDECYSEIYFEEGKAPIGALEAATILGRTDFDKIIVLSSLSKRSNVPACEAVLSPEMPKS